MVNRVDGNYYNDYSQMKSVNTVSDNGEKFSLDYRQENLQSEETEKEDQHSKSAKARKEAAERNGVKLELSKDAAPAAAKWDKPQAVKEQPTSETKSFFASIQEVFTDIMQYVKDFFYKIWNDAAETEMVDEQDNVTGEESFEATLQENLRRTQSTEEELLKKALHTGDLPQVIDILTENGTKTIAKNSTLLTYYDKNGRVVEPSASDRERILHGDRGSRKL